MATYRVTVNGQSYEVQVEEVAQGATPRPLPPRSAGRPAGKVSKKGVGGERPIRAPIPGKVVAVKVQAGEVVTTGSVVVVLDAMKMENDMLSSVDGTVKTVKVQAGDTVNAGDVLIVIE